MNMGLHGLYDYNTATTTESLDYDLPFYLVPNEFLPGEFTLSTDNGATSVLVKCLLIVIVLSCILLLIWILVQ